MRFLFLCVAVAFVVRAEIRQLTLKQVLENALAQNPEIAMARVEERRAASAARAALDPFRPKVFAGSGLAYSSGFPLSIEGSAPSILESRAIASLFNRPQQLSLEKARQDAKTAQVASAMRSDDVAYQAALLYLEAGRLTPAIRAAKEQLASLGAVEESVKARIAEGRELPIEARRAALRVAQARQRVLRLEASRTEAELQLAVLIGLGDGDQVRPAEPDVKIEAAFAGEDAAVGEALRNSKEVQRLESVAIAKGFERKSYEASVLPRVDLVAQYGLLARFNNYDKFFNRFQRHNWQLGASIQIPLIPSLANRAQRESVDAEIVGLRTQMSAARHKATAQTKKAWQQIAAMESGVEVARLDLEVAREQTGLLLSLFEEGRATQRQLEEARFAENEKWMMLYDSRYALDRARLDLLKETGTLVATLRN